MFRTLVILKNTVYLLCSQVFWSFYLTNHKTIIMQKTIFFKNPFFLFIVMLLFIASCNNNDSATAKTDAENTTDKTTTSDVTKKATLISGNLDTLWMDATTFLNLGNGTKLTFRFYDTLNSFTLHGWKGNSNAWNKPPDIRLIQGRQSIVEFGSGNYFGNLQLSNPDFIKISNLIKAKGSKYVVFGPEIPITGTIAGQIIYNIFVTKDDPADPSPTFVHKFLLDPTGTSTNPSPPKNSTN